MSVRRASIGHVPSLGLARGVKGRSTGEGKGWEGVQSWGRVPLLLFLPFDVHADPALSDHEAQHLRPFLLFPAVGEKGLKRGLGCWVWGGQPDPNRRWG